MCNKKLYCSLSSHWLKPVGFPAHSHKNEDVAYNQKGYVGKSMSVRAKQAYDDGEMPKSKWSKNAMLDALAEEFGEDESAGFKKFSKEQLFNGIMRKSSWHHTGKFANATDFYSLDRSKAMSFADNNSIDSMDDIISNDKDYKKQKSDAEQQAKEWEIEKQKEEKEKQKKKEKEKEIIKEIPAIISNSLSEITTEPYKWYDVLSFNVTTPNNWIIKFHADTDNEDAVKALNDFYNDIKNKKETNKTKIIYDIVATLSTSTVNGKTIDGDNMVYKNFNIKQI